MKKCFRCDHNPRLRCQHNPDEVPVTVPTLAQVRQRADEQYKLNNPLAYYNSIGGQFGSITDIYLYMGVLLGVLVLGTAVYLVLVGTGVVIPFWAVAATA